MAEVKSFILPRREVICHVLIKKGLSPPLYRSHPVPTYEPCERASKIQCRFRFTNLPDTFIRMKLRDKLNSICT